MLPSYLSRIRRLDAAFFAKIPKSTKNLLIYANFSNFSSLSRSTELGKVAR